MRIGSVPFLNARPLVWGLDAEHRITYRPPSRLAALLRRGSVDVVLAPVVELFRNPSFRLLDAPAISSRGAVRSVRLLSRGTLDQTRLLLADSNSGTSVLLAQLILRKSFGLRRVRVRKVDVVKMSPAVLKRGEALLQIGDIALEAPPRGIRVWDLGLLWRRLTGLPPVFAVWMGRKGRIPGNACDILRGAAREGKARPLSVVRAYGPLRGRNPVPYVRYLRSNLSYRLGAPERRTLLLLKSLLHEEGLL